MPPSIADASKGDLSPTDLLIRSITTILWLLWPKAKNSQSHSKHHLQRLSRLSLLFVSATQAADVAAITAIVDRSCVHVEAIQGQEEAPDGRLDVAKNHLEFTLWNAAKLPGPEDLKAELVQDPLRFCFTRGIAAITPDAHGAALQKLLTDMYELAPTCPETQSSRDPLRFYVYCFCHKKILHRLQYGILGYSGRFLELFLGSNKQSAITVEDFQRRSKLAPESPKRGHFGEAWLYRQLVGRYRGEDFGPEPSHGQSYRLRLNESQLWKLWEYFTSCLDDLQYSLKWLDQNTRGNHPESYSKAKELLKDNVTPLMRILYNFVHASPTFWRLIVAMSDILSNRMGEERVAEDPQPLWSSPSDAGSPNSKRFTSAPGEVASNRRGSQSPVSADSLPKDSDQPDMSDENHPGSPAQSDGEDSDDGLESEEAKGTVELSGIALKIKIWLRRVTQWHGAIFDLSQGQMALGVLNKQLSIHVDVAPKAVQPERQASLRATVESLEGKGNADDKLNLILSRAREVYKGRNLSQNTAAHSLVNASLNDDASLERWEKLFPSSSVHCEARLACKMHQMQIQNVAIGVSKRCCYCCAILLEKLGSKKDDISNHGKVYSWPPPPEMDSGVKEYILKKLKRRLEKDLEDYSEGRREPDSSSGSEMGSSFIDDYEEVMGPVRRDYFIAR
ncbi:hypothetical protein FS837_004877 [Tulasnella sp. UAMH 9824]|nr:hypothetical protein FS837_004877 [Tulasnella sp. UAMH 9824]